ncbi:MAG: nif-specific transcriptional activator NifA [Nitrospirota bacterium]
MAKNINTIDELNRKILELSTLYEITKKLGSSLNLESILNSTMDILANKMGMKRGTLTVLDRETKELKIEVAHGLTREEKDRGRYKIGEGITGKVLETGEPLIIPDIGKEPKFLNKTKSRGDIKKSNISFICVPVKVHNDVVGALSVDKLFSENVSFEEDVRLLTIIASVIGQAVKINQIVEKERQELIDENIYLKQELKTKYRLKNVIGNSEKMLAVYDAVERVSKSNATVLLRGESGTGKELIARAVHYNSPRADQPFIKINCGAIPETLLESELFGHEKGAFTGAIQPRIGRFELADKGAIFLDEIGDISLQMQVKLLRVLQERKFERLGGAKTISVNIRIIAATNRNLEKAVEAGAFREDLYYRLNVVPIFMPSLRERRDDIPLLIDYFLKRLNRENNKKIKLSPAAITKLIEYNWPGNVRELENYIERIVIMSSKNLLQPEDISLPRTDVSTSIKTSGMTASADSSLIKTVEEMERQKITEVLKICGGIQARAAKTLGITPRQLGYKLKKYNIDIT